MSGFDSQFNVPGMRSITASANEISVFVNKKVIKGNEELTFDGSDLVVTGNVFVEGSISASEHTSDGTTASNLGSGAGSFAQKVNHELQFRSLVEGANITINEGTNTIEIIGTGGGAGNPAGNNTTIQYNDSDVFNGSDLFTFNKVTNTITAPDTTISGSVTVSRNILPLTSSQYNLGSKSQRFANVYTGDLHLQNERGNWTIYEEVDMLVVVNNITGKKYKMNLIPLDD
tara:strand:- start:933 stop:1622 length:690 start_codon:yes stop_codon:yes gene_type:complete